MGTDGPTAGINFLQDASVPTEFNVSNTWTSLQDIEITHPKTGFVNCIGMGHVDYDSQDGGAMYLGWGLEDGTSAPQSYNVARAAPATSTDRRFQFSTMNTFGVSGRGVTDFYLKVRTDSADSTAFDFGFHSLVCMYFPERYGSD